LEGLFGRDFDDKIIKKRKEKEDYEEIK